MKVAPIHDHLAQDGGAEKVLKALSEIFPSAPIYTLLSEKNNVEKNYPGRQIETSIIQKLPGGIKHYQWYMPFMPMAVEFFDLSGYDLVVSDSASFAKGIITKPEVLHIDYCHTPTRYLWSDTHQYINELKYNKFFKKIISLVLNYIRLWDRQAADRVDFFIANSKTVQKRIQKYYRRNSLVIYPPVDTGKYNISGELLNNDLKKEDYFLIGCRLAPYKRVDIVIEAFKKMPERKLKIFGNGVDENRLKKITKEAKNIEFLGRVESSYLAKLFYNARAFIHPQEEDFGISAAESIACGTPVIAYRKGGAIEIITENSGIFFDKQTPEAVIVAVNNFSLDKFTKSAVRAEAEKFSVENFKNNIKEYIDKKLTEFKQ